MLRSSIVLSEARSTGLELDLSRDDVLTLVESFGGVVRNYTFFECIEMVSRLPVLTPTEEITVYYDSSLDDKSVVSLESFLSNPRPGTYIFDVSRNPARSRELIALKHGLKDYDRNINIVGYVDYYSSEEDPYSVRDIDSRGVPIIQGREDLEDYKTTLVFADSSLLNVSFASAMSASIYPIVKHLKGWSLVRDAIPFIDVNYIDLTFENGKVVSSTQVKRRYPHIQKIKSARSLLKNHVNIDRVRPLIDKFQLNEYFLQKFPGDTRFPQYEDVKTLRKKPKEEWMSDVIIVRPSGMIYYSGKNVYVVTTPEELNERVEQIYEENTISKPEILATEYILNPYLYQGKKFHVRVYSIATTWGTYSTFRQYRILTARDPYVLGDWSNPDVHDTHLDSTPGFITTEMFPEDVHLNMSRQIETMMNDIRDSMMDLGGVEAWPESRYGYYLFGTDIMFTEDLQLKLIEVNASPGISVRFDSHNEVYHKSINKFRRWEYTMGTKPLVDMIHSVQVKVVGNTQKKKYLLSPLPRDVKRKNYSCVLSSNVLSVYEEVFISYSNESVEIHTDDLVLARYALLAFLNETNLKLKIRVKMLHKISREFYGSIMNLKYQNGSYTL